MVVRRNGSEREAGWAAGEHWDCDRGGLDESVDHSGMVAAGEVAVVEVVVVGCLPSTRASFAFQKWPCRSVPAKREASGLRRAEAVLGLLRVSCGGLLLRGGRGRGHSAATREEGEDPHHPRDCVVLLLVLFVPTNWHFEEAFLVLLLFPHLVLREKRASHGEIHCPNYADSWLAMVIVGEEEGVVHDSHLPGVALLLLAVVGVVALQTQVCPDYDHD